MRAAVVTRFGEPEVFEVQELPDPRPGPGQVAIDVTHAAVGLVDVYIRQGLYKERAGLPQPPYVPGLEVAGTIRELGEGVTDFRVGESVVTLSGTGAVGGYASVEVADARVTVSLEGTGVDPALAVAALPNAATAYLALTEIAHLKPGERVLVHGALGGLASAFPGVARTLGASVVVGTSRRSSLAAARASALPYDEIIASEDLALATQRFDVVVDPVGGQLRTDSLQVMNRQGRMLLVGNASGDWQHSVPTNALWGGNLALLGFSIGFYLPNHLDKARPAAEAGLHAISQGLVDIRTETLPLADAAEAHRRLETGAVGRRILLTP
ncbi:NADPH2:quinone reductase [Asanoa ferruginea]|uniref:NADPH2:quinone reductase n=1 Tax=Asanoa ferruginea TaxID=53367 RepID=A0A3D9ZR32_9ACTN|nr:zinc-binding dehydrogenase [Asanoa ferruginea]REF98942.1 NADPH2:quinone reductase [Asanoa ferruginea]GIF46376.1 NADPH:quinone reductase [Asanoa ferruginea]